MTEGVSAPATRQGSGTRPLALPPIQRNRMKLTATKRLKRYGGKDIRAGEVFECKPSDVRILKALNRATDYVEPPPKRVAAVFKPIAPAPVAETESVVAAQIAEFAATASAHQAMAEAEDKPKRAYKRRDMVSE